MFDKETCSTTELRQPAHLIARLKAAPFTPIELERYGMSEGVIVSTALWEILEGMARGEVEVMRVPVEGLGPRDETFYKVVIVRRLGAREQSAEFEVLVDWMRYTLVVREGDEGVDPSQKLWRHHPDVAHRVVALGSP